MDGLLEGRTGDRVRSDNVAEGGFFEAGISLEGTQCGGQGDSG